MTQNSEYDIMRLGDSMCNGDLILDDLVFPVSDEHWIKVDEIPEPQSGKLVRGSFGTFSIKEQNDE